MSTPTPIRTSTRSLARMLRHREHRLASAICVLSLVLCFLLGVERYQARELRAFVAETERRQGESAWVVYLATLRRTAREERWKAEGQLIPPASSDQGPARSLVTLRIAASPYPTQVQVTGPVPTFERTTYPVSRVPDWGAMRTPREWDRSYWELAERDFVALPRYDLEVLTTPLATLTNPIRPESIPFLTAKLTYSTRYYGAYDLDAGEFSGVHPGIDLKLAFGTPVSAIAAGRVQTVSKDGNLGLHVIVEHRLPSGEVFFSIYGHLDTAWVTEGQAVEPAGTVGTVGLTGNTTAPHVHLQVDRDDGSSPHRPFSITSAGMHGAAVDIPSPAEADRHTVNPITFIERYREGLL